jgi:hypothetical protein
VDHRSASSCSPLNTSSNPALASVALAECRTARPPFSMASFSVAASAVPRCSARLRMISTRQRGISACAFSTGPRSQSRPCTTPERLSSSHTAWRGTTQTAFEEIDRSWVSPTCARHHTFPVRLSPGGCSFQLGLTSMCRPRAPHLAQTILGRNDGTVVSAGQAETSSRAPCKHSGLRQDISSRCTPRLALAQRHRRAGWVLGVHSITRTAPGPC